MVILSAVKQNSIFDNFGMALSLIGVSMPSFWLGLLLILAFSLNLKWFPSGGFTDWKSLVLPAITLGSAASMASMTRMTRSAMLDALSEDYVRTARAKGLSPFRVVGIHALRNAMIPVITTIGMQIGVMLAGAILTETVFAWPGIGRLMFDALMQRDYPVLLGVFLVTAMVVVAINFIADLLYRFVDPRIAIA